MLTRFFRFAFRPALTLLLVAPLVLTACKDDDDDPKPANQDNELITTVRYSLTPAASSTGTVWVQFRDGDGDGGNPPVVTSSSGDGRLRLKKGFAYIGKLLVLDESKTPADTTSNEIKEEANEHLLVYAPSPAALLTVTSTDRDTNTPPLPLGLETRVETSATSGTGTLTVTLRHQPGTKNGTAAPGDTDIEVSFPVDVVD